MLARVQSYLLQGIDALPCEVEVDLYEFATQSESRSVVVGLPDTAVKESVERVRAALVNSGYVPPTGRLVVNLAPADVRKEGPLYDLPIAIGLLMTQGIVRAPAARPASGTRAAGAVATNGDHAGLDHRRFLFAGELALDGRLRPIRGAIAMAALARARGAQGVIIPADNAAEAAVVEGLEVLGARTLTEVVGLLAGEIEPVPEPAPDVAGLLKAARAAVDFLDVRGQEAVKRAITIAAAGSHNLLRLWPSVRHGERRGRRLPCRTHGHNCFKLWPSVGHGDHTAPHTCAVLGGLPGDRGDQEPSSAVARDGRGQWPLIPRWLGHGDSAFHG